MSLISQRLIDVHLLLPVRVAFRGTAQSGILLLEQGVGRPLGAHGWQDRSRMGDDLMTVDDRLLQVKARPRLFTRDARTLARWCRWRYSCAGFGHSIRFPRL